MAKKRASNKKKERNKKKTKNESNVHQHIVVFVIFSLIKGSVCHPSGSTLRHGTLVVSQSFPRRKESTAIVAKEFTNLPVLGHLVSQTIVLSRKSFGTTLRAGEGHLRFGSVSLHVDFQSVLTREPTNAAGHLAWKSSLLVILLTTTTNTNTAVACRRGTVERLRSAVSQ